MCVPCALRRPSRRPSSCPRFLLLCTAFGLGLPLLLLLGAAIVALVGHERAGSAVPSALLGPRTHAAATSAAHGATRVADQSLASSILHAARRKFRARQNLARRHAAHRAQVKTLDGFTLDKKAQAALAGRKSPSGGVPDSSLLSRMPVANSAKGIVAAAAYLKAHSSGKASATKKMSRADKLEYDIAHHKLTTRGLIAAVHEVQQHQEKELDASLKDQTDDLIVAKINQLRGGRRRESSNTQHYILNNALTPGILNPKTQTLNPEP